MTKQKTWLETPVRCSNVSSIVFDPSNRIIAVCSNNECLFFNVTSGERISYVEQSHILVGAYFKTEDEVVTVTSTGEMCVWSLSGAEPSILAKYKINGKITYIGLEGEEVIALVEEGKKGQALSLLREDGKLEKLCAVGAEIDEKGVSVSSSLIAVCCGNKLRTQARDKHAKVQQSDYENRLIVEALGERNGLNVFEVVDVQGETVAASLSIGRVFIWSDVLSQGISRCTQSVHWHKSAPCLALSPFGGLFSAGGERLVCKWKLGQGAPSMLPRMGAPVSRLTLSPKSTHLALLLEDNSIVLVDPSAMAVQSNIPVISRPTRRKDDILMVRDPLNPDMIVMEGREGCLQWFHPASSTSPFLADISLDNGVDRDLPIYKVTQEFYSVTKALLTSQYVATVEEESVKRTNRNRIRVWRRDDNQNTLLILEHSQMITCQMSFISSYDTSSRHDLFILTDCNGRSCVLQKTSQQFHMDPSKDFSWKGAVCRSTSSINCVDEWAASFVATSQRDAIVVVRVNNMSVRDVMLVDGSVNNVQWSGEGLIASSDKGVWCWSASTLTLKWKVLQPWNVTTVPIPVAWKDTNIVLLDKESGRPSEMISSSLPIREAFPFRNGHSFSLLIVHSDTSLSIMSNSSLSSCIRRRLSSFRGVQSLPQPTPSLPPSSIPSLQSLNGPAHMLPPISLLAPSFITSCLLPLSAP